MTRYHLLLLLLLAFPVASPGQLHVSGRILARDGAPVAGVHVVREEGSEKTISDTAGYFRLTCRLPCTLRFSHVAYREETLVLSGDEGPFVVVLRDRENRLDEVIVTGVATGGNPRVASSQIDRVPAILGERDVLKYLATLPGVITTNPFNAGIYVRGGNSHENGFLVNDMPIANPDHLTGVLSSFDPYILGNSTLYKSGFPARYNGFLSSYLNIRPDAGNKEHHEGEITLGLVSSSLKAKGPLLRRVASYAISARSSYLQQIARAYNRRDSAGLMPGYAFRDITIATDARLSTGWRLSSFGLFTIDDLDMKLGENARYRFRWNTLSGNLLLSRATPVSLWTMQVGARSAFSEGSASGSIPMGGGNRYRAWMSRLSYTRSLADGVNIQAGLRGERDRFETASREDGYGNLLFKSSDKRFSLFDAYLDGDLRATERVAINAGVNLQYYHGETRASVLSPRLKISYTGPRLSLWMDYAKSAQYLGLYPYFTVKTPVDIWYPLGPGDRPATCHQLSTGASRKIGQRANIYAGLFYKKMYRVKDFTRDSGSGYDAAGERQIEGTGQAKGFEIDLSFHYRALHANGNYTLSESRRAFAAINDGKPFFPPYDVKHNIVLNLFLAISPRFSFTALWSYSSGVNTTFPTGVVVAHNLTDPEDKPVIIPVYQERYNYRLPASHRLDVGLDHAFSRGPLAFKLTAGAYNLYNHPNPSFVYFQLEESNNYPRLLPRSKVLLPFIPHVSLRVNW
ncbi:MAG: TonB-dependent receptor [Odoribacteraceae bacterium]|jgi:hypothetical protein|nr:TonB-dependent receptor [Odoribacteraceae bacterium]